MTDEELIARLRDTADHARFEPHLHHTAADRIAALRQAVQHANDHADAAIKDMEVVARKLEQETLRRQGMTDTAFEWKARAETAEARLIEDRAAWEKTVAEILKAARETKARAETAEAALAEIGGKE